MIDEKLWARINYFWYNGGMKSQNEQELIALGKQLGQRLEKQDVVILNLRVDVTFLVLPLHVGLVVKLKK